MTYQKPFQTHDDDNADEASSLLLTATKKKHGVPRRAMIATACVLLCTLAVIYGGRGSSSSNNSNTNRTDGSSISAALLLGHNQAAPVAKYGGDCRNTPTYCDRARVSENVVHCYCKGPWFGDEDAPPKSFNAHLCRDKRCSEQVYLDFPDWCSSDYMRRFGGCSGGCSGTYDCLNLNFHCAEGEYCEMECTGKNSCVGLTMYCADNQVCELKCNGRGSCVNAKVTCGKGTVAQSDGYNHGCVLAGTAEYCDSPIQPQTKCFKCVSGENCCFAKKGRWDFSCPRCEGSF